MKKITVVVSLALAIATWVATAGELPQFFKETLPEHAAGQMVGGWGAVQGEGAALDAKTRELIALAVAAQIPCQYCTFSHMSKLRKMGASEAEIREAIATAGYIRLWSTVLHGNGYDIDAFKAEYTKLLSGN